MKLTIGILAITMVAANVWAQNPDNIQNARDTMKAVQLKKQIDSDAALEGAPARTAQPAAAQSATPSADTVVTRREMRISQAAKARPTAKAAAQAAKPKTAVASKPKQNKQQKIAVEDSKAAAASQKKEPARSYSLSDRRDPFVSPVVNRSMMGSGCSTGKRCLAIDQIALKGVVRSDNGMIAVVVNALDKAYFLRENDPVFNGYVVKITGDSIIFKETVQDRMGKPFTREVTKKITTPAV
jgi:Tfp pilus assembly protein PilP